MKTIRTLIFALVVAALSAPAFAGGTLQGKVIVKNKKGKAMKKDAANVVIFLENLKKPNKKMKRTLMQKGKKFSPRVVPIVMGGLVEFPNQDSFNHNVFSPTKGYKFDLDYFGYGRSKKVRFKKTGAVRIYCNIHSNMVADVLVVPNKWYAKAKKNGKFKIKGIPPGKYTFIAWQPTGASEKRNIKIKDGKTTKQDFKVTKTVFRVKHKNKFGQAYAKDY